MTKKQELVEKLKLMGFSEYAAKTYLAIVRLGKSTPTELAGEAEVPKGKIYEVLEDLYKNGFVGKDESSKRMKYFADKPIKRFKEFLKQFSEASNDLLDELEKSYETAGGAHEYGFYSVGNFTDKLNTEDYTYIFAKDDKLFNRFFEGKKVVVEGTARAHNFYTVGGSSDALVAFTRHRMIVLIEKDDRVQFVSIEDPLFASAVDQLMALSSVNRSLTTEMDDIQELAGEKILYVDSLRHAEGSVFGQNGTLWISNKRFFVKIPGKETYAVPIFAIKTCKVNPDGRLELIVKGRDRTEEIIIYPESESVIIANLINFILENGKK